MKFLSRVVWSEGMHLGPHHFQTQSRYFEDTLWFLNGNAREYPWGFLNLSLDEEALRNGHLILTAATGIMPDGLIFDMPDCDSPPAPANLSALFEMETSVTLFLAIPPLRDFATDLEGNSNETRYGSVERTLRDETLGEDERTVSFGQKNFLLTTKQNLPAGAVGFPIAKIQRDLKGGFLHDPAFIAPSLRIGASEPLATLLLRLVETIEDKITRVRQGKRRTSGLELGTSALDVANYWFLHCLCSATPGLRKFLTQRVDHPEDLYRAMAKLAGALSTFSLEAKPDEIPHYDHLDLAATFGGLNLLIRKYLDVVVPSNTVTLDFEPAEPYVFAAQVDDERCLRRARWIFGIRSPMSEALLLRSVPRLVKLCSAGGIHTLVSRALPGLELMHLPVPPSALDAQADMHYFSISLNGVCWQHILQTRKVGVYLPAEIGEATFELSILLEHDA